MNKITDNRFKEIINKIKSSGEYYFYYHKGDKEIYNEVYEHYSTIVEDKRVSKYLLQAKCGYFEYITAVSLDELHSYFETYLENKEVVEKELDFIISLLMWLGDKELVEV